jgi:hypothetical protein
LFALAKMAPNGFSREVVRSNRRRPGRIQSSCKALVIDRDQSRSRTAQIGHCVASDDALGDKRVPHNTMERVMAKAPTRKPWTPDDLKVLKKLARQKAGAEKIAKTLKRTPAAVRNKAVIEQISLSTR